MIGVVVDGLLLNPDLDILLLVGYHWTTDVPWMSELLEIGKIIIIYDFSKSVNDI